MTPTEAAAFIDRYVAARATQDGATLAALWSPAGRLVYPFTDRELGGDEIARLTDQTHAAAPDLVWEMIGWTHREAVVVLEWRCARRFGERTFSWAGVDKFTLRDGLIVEEIVYTDTAPLHALRRGETFAPLMTLQPA